MSSKEQKELAITIGLLVIFAIVLATSFKPKKHPKKAPVSKSNVASTQNLGSFPPPPPVKGKGRRKTKLNTDLAQKQQERAKLEWGRDPFFSSYSSVSLKGGGNLSLKGISYSKDNPAALINTDVVFVGDKVGRAEVLEIKKNEVFLREGERKFILRLEEK